VGVSIVELRQMEGNPQPAPKM
jgi:hypothetical protein